MKMLNYGSLNMDYVYQMHHFIKAGETQSSQQLTIFAGGKGLNQSIALARAGADVFHAGKIGNDGHKLLQTLSDSGVDVTYIYEDEGSSGHAIIQVNKEGENCIILHGGANLKIQSKEIRDTLSNFNKGDFLLLQNEINNNECLIKSAKEKGMTVIFNPAPMDDSVENLPLELIDILIVNEIEGAYLSGASEPDVILERLCTIYPGMTIVLTLGAQGAKYRSQSESYSIIANKGIKVIDTTAAGDTFIGYFLAVLTQNGDAKEAMTVAGIASELCITKKGAAISIPSMAEVQNSYISNK